MMTLILKFAGPMQAWPAHSRGTVRPSQRAPTYSGLSGLARCALGLGRDNHRDVLGGLTIAVRVDRVGRTRWDYHSINQIPIPDRRFQREREFRPNTEKMGGGPYSPTVLTEREYVHDAVFLVFIEGEDLEMTHLTEAFMSPQWQVFLGRKCCPPPPDFVLGLFTESAAALVRQLPLVAAPNPSAIRPNEKEQKRTVEVHWLSGPPGESESIVESWTDQPGGPVGDSYQVRPRWLQWVGVAAVPSNADQRGWVWEKCRKVGP